MTPAPPAVDVPAARKRIPKEEMLALGVQEPFADMWYEPTAAEEKEDEKRLAEWRAEREQEDRALMGEHYVPNIPTRNHEEEMRIAFKYPVSRERGRVLVNTKRGREKYVRCGRSEDGPMVWAEPTSLSHSPSRKRSLSPGTVLRNYRDRHRDRSFSRSPVRAAGSNSNSNNNSNSSNNA
jgi:hypothetical protein